MPKPPGPLGPGRTLHKKGYVVLNSGMDRGKLEHRAVIEKLKREQRRHAVAMLIGVNPELSEWMIPWLLEQEAKDDRLRLSLDDEVHHIDWVRQNNRPINLLLVDARMHAAWSAGNRAVQAGKFKQRNGWMRRLPGMAVDGEVDGEVDKAKGTDTEEVPF